MNSLKGRVALVTGAARGLGASACRHLATHGVNIVAVDACRSIPGFYPMGTYAELNAVASDCRGMGVQAVAEMADVRNDDDVVRVVEDSVQRFGRIDILVNNAGVCADGSVIEFLPEMVDAILDINLRSAFSVTRAVARHMVTRDSGRIINIASSAGGIKALAGGSPYAASKAGLIMATKCWAHDLAPHGINVNAVSPGVVLTGMVEGLARIDHPELSLAEAYAKYAAGALLQGRRGIVRPDDVSAAIAFLASDQSRMVTGEILAVDAGVVAS